MSETAFDPTDKLIGFLNELLAADPAWMTALIGHRLPCNQAIIDHPAFRRGVPKTDCREGVLGLLSGFCVACNPEINAKYWPIMVVIDNGQIIHFMRGPVKP